MLNQTATAEADLPMSNFDMAFSFFPMGPWYGKQNRLKSLIHPETFRGLTDKLEMSGGWNKTEVPLP